MASWVLETGDCLEKLAELPDNSIDACVTDPPYELGFMRKDWDSSGVAFRKETWAAVLRVLKPGGHLLAFSGTRTSHRMVCAIEDAGFEIRDSISWLYGTGFPKSLDVSKALDKVAGFWRGKAGAVTSENVAMSAANYERTPKGDPITAAAAWEGWGTTLKPALEPVCVARKPLEGTVAENVAKWGTGCLNIGGCRIEGVNGVPASPRRVAQHESLGDLSKDPGTGSGWDPNIGRWPANVVLDEEAGAMLDAQSGVAPPKAARTGRKGGCQGALGEFGGSSPDAIGHWPKDQGGGASRFFYCAKASRAERERGCEGLPPRAGHEAVGRKEGSAGVQNPRAGAGRTASQVRNFHPTVKPVSLMRWLVRLVTPPGGVVLDPFAGSGTTGIAAQLEGHDFMGIEMLEEHAAIARARIEHWEEHR